MTSERETNLINHINENLGIVPAEGADLVAFIRTREDGLN